MDSRMPAPATDTPRPPAVRRACTAAILLSAGLAAAQPPPPPAPATTLELTAAITRALEHNRSLQAARLTAAARALDADAAAGRFAQRLAPEGAATAADAVDTLGYGLSTASTLTWGTDLSAGAGMTRTEPDTGPAAHTARVRIRADQPLFRDAGRLVNLEPLRLAESGHAQALRLLESARADLVLQVVETFSGILRDERLLAADTATVARLERLYRLTEARERQGRATRLERLRVEQQLGQARSRITDRREQAAARQRLLADLLGEDPAAGPRRLAPPPAFELALPAAADATAAAFSNRLDYAQALQDAEDARRGVAVARHQLLPSIRLTAQIEQVGTGTDAAAASRLDETAWFLGIASGDDVLRKADRSLARRAAVDSAAADLQIATARARITRDVQDQLGAYQRALQQRDLAAATHAVALRRQQLAERLYASGRSDNMAVTDAEDALLAAENERLTTETEARIAAYRVLRSMGTLVEYPPELKP